jgi:hypothetical protein
MQEKLENLEPAAKEGNVGNVSNVSTDSGKGGVSLPPLRALLGASLGVSLAAGAGVAAPWAETFSYYDTTCDTRSEPVCFCYSCYIGGGWEVCDEIDFYNCTEGHRLYYCDKDYPIDCSTSY